MESIVGTAPVCSLSSELSGSSLVPLQPIGMFTWNREPSISPENMDMFRTSRELPFEVCNHIEPQASLHTARKGEHFYEEEKEVGRVTVNKEFKVFHWLNAARKGEEYFFFLLNSAIIMEYDIPSSGLWILFSSGFCLCFYKRVSGSILIYPVFMCEKPEKCYTGKVGTCCHYCRLGKHIYSVCI